MRTRCLSCVQSSTRYSHVDSYRHNRISALHPVRHSGSGSIYPSGSAHVSWDPLSEDFRWANLHLGSVRSCTSISTAIARRSKRSQCCKVCLTLRRTGFGVPQNETRSQTMADLKLGQYTKLPPRATFAVQMAGSIIGSIFNYTSE